MRQRFLSRHEPQAAVQLRPGQAQLRPRQAQLRPYASCCERRPLRRAGVSYPPPPQDATARGSLARPTQIRRPQSALHHYFSITPPHLCLYFYVYEREIYVDSSLQGSTCRPTAGARIPDVVWPLPVASGSAGVWPVCSAAADDIGGGGSMARRRARLSSLQNL